MTLEQRVDALSDEFQSTFTVLKHTPTILANMMSPHEVEGVEALIRKHLGWDRVWSVATGQLKNPSYDIYYFSEYPKG